MDKVQEAINTIAFAKKQMSGIIKEKLKDFPISREQSQLLYTLTEEKSCTQKRLADLLFVSEATLSVRIKRLETIGYVKRTTDKKDRRKFRLSVTAKGKKELLKALDIVDATTHEMLEGFTDKELDFIISIGKRIETNIEKIMKESNL